MGSGQLAVGSGQWAVGSGQWAVGSWQLAVKIGDRPLTGIRGEKVGEGD